MALVCLIQLMNTIRSAWNGWILFPSCTEKRIILMSNKVCARSKGERVNVNSNKAVIWRCEEAELKLYNLSAVSLNSPDAV